MYYNEGKEVLHRDAAANMGSGATTHIADAATPEMAHFLTAAANEYGTGGYDRVRHFHEAFGLPINGPGYVPTPEERLLRGKLLLEEVVEHLTKGLGLQFEMNGVIVDGEHLRLGESEIHRYDPVETLDGLCDVKVIANGTGVAFGLPVRAGDALVYRSNMAKLGPDGKPIINGVTPGYRDGFSSGGGWTEAEKGYRSGLPHGKVLKPEGWQAPDMAVLFEQ